MEEHPHLLESQGQGSFGKPVPSNKYEQRVEQITAYLRGDWILRTLFLNQTIVVPDKYRLDPVISKICSNSRDSLSICSMGPTASQIAGESIRARIVVIDELSHDAHYATAFNRRS